METNNTISQLITWLQAAIIAGGIVRLGYCLVVIPLDYEESQSYKKRMKNLIIFVVIATSILGILQTVKSYF